MADQRNRWKWDVSGFEIRNSSSPPPTSVDYDRPHRRESAQLPRYSISSTSPSNRALTSKVDRLSRNLKVAKEDYLELRQEASELQEYSRAKLDRVTRYLGVLADKTRQLDQVALDAEWRIAPLINEKKKLFDDLLTAKGNIKVICRARPLFEDEGSSDLEFPDDFSITVDTSDENSILKKDFEFDRVYGPHVGQAELFNDIQPFVQSALDGFNVSIFSYGQTNSGKTHTLVGSSQERGLIVRCFEELFDLANSDTYATSRFDFSLTVLEIHNEQVRDLLLQSGRSSQKARIGSPEYFMELVQEKVKNPLDISFVLKDALQCRGVDASRFNLSHFIVTIHISYNSLVSGERLYSKLSLVDLAGSEALNLEDGSVDHASEFLHVMKSLSALGDVLSSLTSKKDVVPYENSILTRLLADSIGGNSKTLLITTVSSNASNKKETISSLNFASRAQNTVLSLGNRDTTKRWRDIANGARKELLEKEKEMEDKKMEIFGMKLALKDANDQCVLLFNEVQKAWKVSYTLQSNLKAENSMLTDKLQIEKEQNTRLRNQIAQWMQQEQEHKLQMQQQDSKIQTLQAKIRSMEDQMNEALQSSQTQSKNTLESSVGVQSSPKASGDNMDSSIVTKKLEEELKKRDALIERLHEENEKLFDRLTVKASLTSSPHVEISSSFAKGPSSVHSQTDSNVSRGRRLDVVSVPVAAERNVGSGALVKTSSDVLKITPAGEYLIAALNDFDPEQYEGLATMSDGANKLLMLVLAAVIKAGASREHEILAEIRDAVFSFIRKMEQKRVMDTMLVSRVRILYIRSLLARSPELQSIKIPQVEYFLEKPNSGRSRSSSRGNSPGRSPVRYVEEKIQGFKVNIRPERKSKFSSVVLKLRGIDQETWRQHVTGGKLREITEEAKSFAIGNKSLAALFVHTPAGELQRQIRSWLAENFEFLSVTGDDAIGGTAGQLELLSTAIMDGWMAGLGAAMPPSTDALGQLWSDYTKRVYTSQLQHLKDIAGTLATEEADDLAHVAKLRSALVSVDHKRRKILQQMKGDEDLLTLGGSSPIRSPSTAAEDARLASLISLDSMLKQVKDISGQASTNQVSRSKKAAMLASLDEVEERMPSLLDIDHSCAQNQISDARCIVQSIVEVDDEPEASLPQGPAESGSPAETDVAQWNVLQFNTASITTPFIIKCGSNSNSELVIKADARVQEPKGGEIMRVIPRPSVLKNMSLGCICFRASACKCVQVEEGLRKVVSVKVFSGNAKVCCFVLTTSDLHELASTCSETNRALEDIKQLLSQLPESLSLLALARTADGTRARYSRLYRTLASKVPSLRDLVAELEKGGG